MPELTNPFKLVPDRELSEAELIAVIRQAIIAEHDAVALYTLQAESTDDPVVKEILLDIADEEKVHIGELTYLLYYLTDEEDFMGEGMSEAENKGTSDEEE